MACSDREAMRDQRRQIQFALRDELQKRPPGCASRSSARGQSDSRGPSAHRRRRSGRGRRSARCGNPIPFRNTSLRCSSMPTVPTATTMARSRASSAARLTGLAAGSLGRDQHRVDADAARFLETQIAEFARAGARGLGSASEWPDRRAAATDPFQKRGNRRPSATAL